MLNAFKLRIPTDFEYYSSKLNLWLLIRLSPTKGGMMVYINDITDKKEKEAQGKYDISLLKKIIENIPIGLIVARAPDGKLIFINRHIEKLFGRSLLETTDYNQYSDWLGLHTNGQPYKLEEWPLYRSIKTGEVVEDEEIFFCFKDGTKHLIKIKSHPIRDETCKITAAVAVGIDETATKTYEDKLFKNGQEFKILAENSPDIIAHFNKDLRYIYVNPALEKFLNMPAKEIIGKNNTELGLPLKMVSKYDHKMKRTFETGRVQKTTFSFTVKKTEKFFLSWFVPELNKSKVVTSAFSITRDISEFKKIEKKKDEFLSIASHEIKTPLTSLKGYVQILKKEFSSDNSLVYEYLEKMDSQIDRTVKLINELLEISRVQSGKIKLNKKYFSLNKLIKDTIENIQSTVNTHEITFEINNNVYVYADKDRISQVLINLLSNAIRYSPHANKINVRLKSSKKKVTVYVQDFGVGISSKQQSKIFHMFYRVSNSDIQASSGLGVGLFIAAQIVKCHNGEIHVKSQENKGSTFYFTLPSSQVRHKNI
jgi:PAS domain S-box-containing protein